LGYIAIRCLEILTFKSLGKGEFLKSHFSELLSATLQITSNPVNQDDTVKMLVFLVESYYEMLGSQSIIQKISESLKEGYSKLIL
jgi:hypothetical protein